MALHHRTPLIPSLVLGEALGREVWLKLESAQPCGSFKLRGMGRFCEQALARGATRLVSSSGGNAGYAVAWAGRELGVPVTVVVPTTTGARMRALIAQTGAEVLVHGSVWDEAHAHALELASGADAALVHPFEHPDTWDGHATLVDEVVEAGLEPAHVVLSVGGGGLLCGVVQGLRAHGLTQVPVLAVETEGAASFHDSVKAGHPVTLPAITTIALTLGAKRVADRALELAAEHPITPTLVTDDAALTACERFADDHRVLVEPSCGAALSTVYDRHPALTDGPVLVVVCGGAAVTRQQLTDWRA